MPTTIAAIYEEGVLKPIGKVPLKEHQQVEIVISTSKARVAGLHSGAIWTSDDFDKPLPEEFWVGEA